MPVQETRAKRTSADEAPTASEVSRDAANQGPAR